MIVLVLKAVEGFLLAAWIALGRRERRLLQRRVHALMPTVILRRSGSRERSGTMPSFTHSIDTRLSPPGARRWRSSTPLSV